MYTFLPYADFEESARVLLLEDLEKQVVHTIIALDCLHERDSLTVQAWGRHPLMNMWRGYEVQLTLYGQAMLEQLKLRERASELYAKRLQWHYDTATFPEGFKMEKPPWWSDEQQIRWVERSSRSLLIRRDHRYVSVFPDAQPNLAPYYPSVRVSE